MGRCPQINTCTFFAQHMQRMPSITALFKKRLCEGDSSSCARYYLYTRVQGSNAAVSDEMEAKIAELSANLYPNELARVKNLLG